MQYKRYTFDNTVDIQFAYDIYFIFVCDVNGNILLTNRLIYIIVTVAMHNVTYLLDVQDMKRSFKSTNEDKLYFDTTYA